MTDKRQRHLAVDEPIINSPYKEPAYHWHYDKLSGAPIKNPFRRPAHYYFRSKRRQDTGQTGLFTEEEMVEIGQVNQIRSKVKEWRESGYKGATPVTRKLLGHWNFSEREKRLFFCQIEAVETVIWLKEINRNANLVPKDTPNEEGFSPLPRYCLKMATGSGKTLVMAMIIAWSVINKAHNRNAKWCSNAILIVTPNLTVRERLGGVESPDNDRALIPGAKGNYYDNFELIPSAFEAYLGQAKIQIINWHKLAVNDDSKKRHIVQRGEESPQAFANNVLKAIGGAKNMLVVNDEAHHAYRPAPSEDENLTIEEKKKKEEATIWISGLDMIHKARQINTVIDLSATPFYIQGSGHPEGTPFPWIVSDFGLVDAIESGIVKIPQVPVDSNSGRPQPEYFTLWQWINERLPPKERSTAARKPKPEAIIREADGALRQIAGQWKEKFEEFQENGSEIPPVMIVVCDNTDIAELMHEYISGEKWEEYKDEKGKKQKRKIYGKGAIFPDLLSNTAEKENTVRIDSRLLNESDEGNTFSEALRKKISTVGKLGEPGQDVRCVVSVSMLTEGWDAQNVTQILGIRAFLSQLLCEQVVGRGLRRSQYDDMTVPEYVDVYGIPFEVIPIKKKPQNPPPSAKEVKLVKALPEREHLMIEYPRVEGFICQVKSRITADIQNIEPIEITPDLEPTQTVVCERVGYQQGNPASGPGGSRLQTRESFYSSIRLQQIYYEIALRITDILLSQNQFRMQASQQIFPQVLEIVRAYTKPLNKGGRINYKGTNPKELGLERYLQLVTERLSKEIRPDKSKGEALILPRLERFRPKGSTKEVLFRTSRGVFPCLKSHVSHVVLDSQWEKIAAHYLEQSPLVKSYVKNDHLGFSVEYKFSGSQHLYLPDFLVRLTNNKMIILEIKGEQREQDREKKSAAKRWCEAVSAWGKMGIWKYIECRESHNLNEMLQKESG